MEQFFKHTKRFFVLLIGVTVVGIGIALLVLPGPGILVMIGGLALLATEFAWAEGLLHKAKLYYQRTKKKISRKTASTPNPPDVEDIA